MAEELTCFKSSSLNFIGASHVIEHLRNPIKAIVTAYDRLAKGGWLFLVVPDKRFMSDVHRHATTLDHLLEDFYNPSLERDFGHYLDHYEKAVRTHDFRELAERDFERGLDVHMHVWTCASFFFDDQTH
jgi:predicted SAM-dependent methyltransferase